MSSAERRIGRRDFVAQGAAALASLALAACGGATATSPSSVTPTTLQLSSFSSLANVGGVATTTIDGTPIAIVRETSSSFSAFSRICPHQGGLVSPTNGVLFCPNHGATFDLHGNNIGGQRTSNLTSYPVAYDATAGTITVG
jgi:Rieske Fe-S protein